VARPGAVTAPEYACSAEHPDEILVIVSSLFSVDAFPFRLNVRNSYGIRVRTDIDYGRCCCPPPVLEAATTGKCP